MKTLRLLALILVGQGFLGLATHSVADTFGSGDNQFTIDFVPIGNPGNAADTSGAPGSAGTVWYAYRIGKYEVSRDMVDKANTEANLGITMDIGISNPRPEMPATGISWNEAARFVNWLNTGEGFPSAYKFETQPGDVGYSSSANISLWDSGDAGFSASNPFRNRLAKYFLPSVDEWYKAAYYDPDANGGSGVYWEYPTGSFFPTAVASGTGAGTAVYMQPGPQGPADITQAGGLSPYGVMGLGGNARELEETAFNLVNNDVSSLRGLRGGIWFQDHTFLGSHIRDSWSPSEGSNKTGFRVASRFDITPIVGDLILAGTTSFLLGGETTPRLPGLDYDQVVVTGNLSLGGTLLFRSKPDLVDLGQINPQFAPAHRGQSATFTIIDAGGTVTGSFDAATFDSEPLTADNGIGLFKTVKTVGNDVVFTMLNARWGDLDGDQIVSASDVFATVNNLGPAVVGSDWTRGNFDLDGFVSASDVFVAVGYLGSYTAIPTVGAVPEPSAMLLGVFGLLALLSTRRAGQPR